MTSPFALPHKAAPRRKKICPLGSVEAEKLAETVILAADPTADIRNTRKVEAFIRDGLVCDPKRVLAAVPAR
jgi:hypothetical protein